VGGPVSEQADIPTRPDRIPMHQRVQENEDRTDALEAALNVLIARHNQFVADVAHELALGTDM